VNNSPITILSAERESGVKTAVIRIIATRLAIDFPVLDIMLVQYSIFAPVWQYLF